MESTKNSLDSLEEPNQLNNPIDANIRKQAFWLYGVIIGLAVKEAITSTFPHILKSPVSDMWLHIPEALRLLVFLILCIRFYLGAVNYFDEAYEKCHITDEEKLTTTNQYERKNFGLDFLFGFFHFLLFSALSLSITYNEAQDQQPEVSKYIFSVLILITLLYDVLWYFANRKNDTVHLIKLWMTLNFITSILYGLIFGATWVVFKILDLPFKYFLAESLAFIPLLLISALDIAGLIFGKQIIEKILHLLAYKILRLSKKTD